jgi:hypothetical protein
MPVMKYVADQNRYAAAGLFPSEPVSWKSGGTARGIPTGVLTVSPVQWNMVSNTVRLYQRMLIEVTYVGAGVNRQATSDEKVLEGAFINGIVAPVSKKVNSVASVQPSVLSSGKWFRIAVNDNGVYKLDAAALTAAGVPVSSVDPRTIRIFGNGGTELSEDISAARPSDLVENAIFVQGQDDGKFDAGDYVLFYGKSVRSWKYNSAQKVIRHSINHYSETNYYYLTYGGVQGKRMVLQASNPSPAGVVPTRFRDAVAMEDERLKLPTVNSGKDWYARSLDALSPTFTYMLPLPGLVPNDFINYRFAFLATSTYGVSMSVSETGKPLGNFYIPSSYGYLDANSGEFTAKGSSTLSSSSSQLNVSLGTSSVGVYGYIDWIEVNYPRFFSAVSDYLRFWSPDTSAIIEYQLQNFTQQPTILNVTVPESVSMITGVFGTYAFRAAETGGGKIAEYVAAAPSSWKSPASITAISNQDLHGNAAGADFLIITSPEFRTAADRLAAYREQPAHGDLRTLVVDVSQIYNEFGGGLPDVTAIRDFLKYTYDNWTRRPQFVLMFGGASYDYKGILGQKSSYVPTWETDESRDEVGSYASDDYYVMFGSDNSLSMVIGRISSRTTTEAGVVVDKILRYEDQSDKDIWKMRVVFVGDDAWSTENGYLEGTMHSQAAEDLSQPQYTPDEFEKRKIYIAEYPTVWTVQGRTKPGAFQDIIDQINQGVLIINYSGHGNPLQWAHENIFNVATSIPQLSNSNRLSLFVVATCDFSRFDDPTRYTGSELLMNKSDGGSIAVLSATRKVYAGANDFLNKGTYSQMFTRSNSGVLTVDRPATALYRYKIASGNSTNDQKYFLMGDPTMRVQFPSAYAVIDSISGQPVDSVGGTVRSTPIPLSSLSKVTVSGSVRSAGGQTDQSYTGKVTVTVNDASRNQTIVDFAPGLNWTYVAAGGLLFRGDNSISNGKFKATFVVPKDIAFADSTGRGRVVAYCTGVKGDARGYTANVRVVGADSSAKNNGIGPQISIFLNSRSFRAGDLVNTHPNLIVDFADSNGINTSGTGIGHRIEAWVNNSTQSQDLTQFFTSKIDNYREGTVEFPMANLPLGRNTIRVRAWDSFNNSNSAEAPFDVASDDPLTIQDVLNYPNPFAGGTSFTFKQNTQNPLRVKITIYTVAGRLIQTLESTTGGEQFVRIPWDGRDRDGDILGNGIYYYKLIASTVDGHYSSDSLGKVVVLR